jgi:hypothetical protein
MNKHILSYLLIALIAIASGCKKFLNEKPDARLDVPSSLTDFQALIDYYPAISNSEPCSGEMSGDNYYLFDADYQALASAYFKRIYTWQNTGLFAPGSNEWFTTYRPVFTANTILDNLYKVSISPVNQNDFNNVKGEALYIRGKAFLKIAGLWTSQYDGSTASSQLGIPIRLTSDFNQASVRSNLQETYNQVIADLIAAAHLLPVTPLQVLRPSKPAAYALLARAYLFMGSYMQAKLYADSCLQLFNTLIDYNNLNTKASYPLAKFNPEVIQESLMITSPPLNNVRARIDTDLYSSYAANDLRKTIFFKAGTNGSHVFRGSYEGSVSLFGGIATDEVYLIRAECLAREGNTASAINDLNTLLITRFKAGTFIPFVAANSTAALALILTERRKELLMRGLRWNDLKRLNNEGANITLIRTINGQTYTLLPNDLRYALPIPDDIIQLTGMAQNPR